MLNVLLIEWHCIWLRETYYIQLYLAPQKNFLYTLFRKDIGRIN